MATTSFGPSPFLGKGLGLRLATTTMAVPLFQLYACIIAQYNSAKSEYCSREACIFRVILQ